MTNKELLTNAYDKSVQEMIDQALSLMSHIDDSMRYSLFSMASTNYIPTPSIPTSVPMHVYPDGSKRSVFPSHDEFFNEWNKQENSGCGGIVTWQFNSITGAWIRLTQSPNQLPTHHFQPTSTVGSGVWNMGGSLAINPNSTVSSATQQLNNQYTYTYNGTLSGYTQETEEKKKIDLKCECGAHKVESNQHSDWCQAKGNT